MTEISIIIPIHNGEKWIKPCMDSIAGQSILNLNIKLEVVSYNDGSIDKTLDLLKQWAAYFKARGVNFVIEDGPICKGVGAAKNGAVKASTGKFLCFQDIDDVMHPQRILLQWQAAKRNHNAIIGSKISRIPVDSTPRLVHWANNLSQKQLKEQIFTSNGPTLLMPTWFCHRSVYDNVGGFVETGSGTPEDLIFFYDHLDVGGDLYRVDQELVIYTYHENAATFSVNKQNIWEIQLNRLVTHILPFWKHFTVWNAGKCGRRLVRSLDPKNLNKVIAFCDVDKNKIGRTVELYCPIKRKVIMKLPVVHYAAAKPPLLICMKLDLTNGEFEKNLKSLNLKEGTEYVIFN